MKAARGNDPGPDGEAIAPEPNLYLRHVPTVDRDVDPGKGLRCRLVEIAGWATVAAAGLKMTGLL